MRRGFYLLIIFILIAGIVLAVYAPDNISMVFIAIMEAVIFLGIIFGILPTMQYERGFQTAMDNIASAVEGQTVPPGQRWKKAQISLTSAHWTPSSRNIRQRCAVSGKAARFWPISTIISTTIPWRFIPGTGRLKGDKRWKGV